MATWEDAAVNAAIDALAALCNGGELRFYDDADTELIAVTFANPAFGAASGGEASAATMALATGAVAGTVSYAKIFKADGVTEVAELTVNDEAGSDVVLNTLVLSAGDTLLVTSVELSEGTEPTWAAASTTAAVTAVKALFNAGTLKFYSAADALLATCTFGATAFGSVAAGLWAVAYPITQSAGATAGTVSYAKAFKSDGVTLLARLTCTGVGGGGDLELSNLVLGGGDIVSVTALSITGA